MAPFPGQVPYQLITLTSNIVVSWPFTFSSNQIIAGWNNVTTAANGYTITLPDATLTQTGQGIIFNNISAYSFQVLANDGVTLLATIASGKILYFNLNNSSTANGLWDVTTFGGGTTAITTFTAESTDNTITVTNGVITPPGGIINFKLPTSIANLNNVNITGFPVITGTVPLTWASRDIIAGTNITITNGDGIADNPIISLSPTIDGLTDISVGNLNITNSAISAIDANSGITLASNGSGTLDCNGVSIDTSRNITQINNLTVNGTFYNSFTPKAWCVFTDTLLGINTHNIIIRNQANIASITGAAGKYTLTFINPLNTNTYGVLITVGTETSGGLPIVAHGFSIFAAQTTTQCQIAIVDASGQYIQQALNGITVQILSAT